MRAFLQSLAIFAFVWIVGQGSSLYASDDLPWEKDLASAVAKAKKQSKPLFIMMTATWCGPCKKLESETLTNRLVRECLRDFVWVQAFEDKALEKTIGCDGYPTLAFVSAENETVFSKLVGYKPAGSFVKKMVDIRKTAGLKTPDKVVAAIEKTFDFDSEKVAQLLQDGDGAGLKQYFAPLKEDILRSTNYVVGKLELPEGTTADQVECKLGKISIKIVESGLFVCPVSRSDSSSAITIHVPGHKLLEQKIVVPKGDAVLFKKFSLAQLRQN